MRKAARPHLVLTAVLASAALTILLGVGPASARLPQAAPHPSAKPVATGIWISRGELRKLPMHGKPWLTLKQIADGGLVKPQIANQDSRHDVDTLAVALVFARTGLESYRQKAVDAIMSAIGTEQGGRTLALNRNLFSYVIAADLVNLAQYDPVKDAAFRSWLEGVRNQVMAQTPEYMNTLIKNDSRGPGNWGRHAGASRVAVDVYLGDTADLAAAVNVFRGWLGDRSTYADFVFRGDRSWHADPAQPLGVNPAGAVKEGYPIDGVLPADMRRGGSFRWPPGYTQYPREGLSGAIAEAEVLCRQGYDVWNWSDRALLRATTFLHNLSKDAGEQRWWEPHLWQWWVINHRYGGRFPVAPTRGGKNMAWTDWTHGRGRALSACARQGSPGRAPAS